MADLKNSQRISYKATYSQISPTAPQGAPPNQPKTNLSRAVEKAAFVQSLKITPPELEAIKKQLSDRPKAKATNARPALNAIERLIKDGTSTSTLNNAAAFARIDQELLIAIAAALVAYRDRIGDATNRSVADIITAYQSALLPPKATSAKAQTPRPLARGTTSSSTTPSGVSIVKTVLQRVPSSPRSSTASARRAKGPGSAPQAVDSVAFSAHISIDESKPLQTALTSILSVDPSQTYQPPAKAAIAWAEKFRPDLFTTLAGHLQPYMGMSVSERTAVGGANSLVAFMASGYQSRFDTDAIRGAMAGFQSRMTIEPIGNLHLERIEMYPAGVQRGELVHSVPLAPSETVNISHKEWSVAEREFEDIVHDYFEGYSEQGVAEKSDMAMSNDSQSQHATALNLGASLSASYASVTLSTNFGYNATTNDQQSRKDSRNHSMAITKKASARTKKDHKVTFKVTSVAGSEDQSVRIISNPSATDSMRIDYFQLARKWKVDLMRYGLRMTYDIVIPNPGSGLVSLVRQVKDLDVLINQPFTFTLPLSAIYYNSLASDPHAISNYDQLAAQFNATVTPPPEARKWVNVHKEIPKVDNYDDVHFDAIEFEIDESYYIYEVTVESRKQINQGETRNFFTMLNSDTLDVGLSQLIGESGHLSIDFMYQYIYNYGLSITFACRPKVQSLLDWRLQVWNQIRQAAEDQYNKSLQSYKDQRAELVQQIQEYDALTLRRMEQEEIMKGVLRWLLGPQFYLVPFNLSYLFGPDTNDPEVQDVLDPNRLSSSEWIDVMEHGEFIKYIHNAIEWENVLYFTYPYFWDDNQLWDFKKFLYHPDPTHRTFLRSGAARVVLTIRPGFEPSFTSLVETGAFGSLPGPHPYVTIAQEIQDFAQTNYPGFPPANPEQNARPLLYLEQRRVWREMQFIIQLLNACKLATGSYPPHGPGNTVPVAALTPYLNGPIVVGGQNYNGVNDYNTQANNQQLALDPLTPQEALLPTYVNVPASDVTWNNPYFYKCPGDTGDYDLISYGADGKPGGVDKNADISANAEASLISTWYEYTPTNALDIGITMNLPNVVPPEPSPDIA